ncbi:MAG: CV_2116 domain-containing protein [Syntrophobacteraceae bacterium]
MGFIYKDYLLRSKSVQLPEKERWTIEVTIARKKGSEGEVGEQTYSSENTFPSKELADMESIIFARKIIDGEICGLSVKDQNENCS